MVLIWGDKGLAGTFFPKDLKQSPLHLLVSHAVDDGVEHGSEDHIQRREHLVSQARVCGAGKDVAEHWSDREHTDHSDVSATGGKGFPSALSTVNPENSSHNVYIEDHEQGAGGESRQKTKEEQGKFICLRAGAREFQQCREVTGAAGDEARSTEFE